MKPAFLSFLFSLLTISHSALALDSSVGRPTLSDIMFGMNLHCQSTLIDYGDVPESVEYRLLLHRNGQDRLVGFFTLGTGILKAGDTQETVSVVFGHADEDGVLKVRIINTREETNGFSESEIQMSPNFKFKTVVKDPKFDRDNRMLLADSPEGSLILQVLPTFKNSDS